MDGVWWWLLLALLVLGTALRWMVVRRPSSRYGQSRYGGTGVVGRRAAVGSDREDVSGELGGAGQRDDGAAEEPVALDADVDLRDERETGEREPHGRELGGREPRRNV